MIRAHSTRGTSGPFVDKSRVFRSVLFWSPATSYSYIMHIVLIHLAPILTLKSEVTEKETLRWPHLLGINVVAVKMFLRTCHFKHHCHVSARVCLFVFKRRFCKVPAARRDQFAPWHFANWIIWKSNSSEVFEWAHRDASFHGYGICRWSMLPVKMS